MGKRQMCILLKVESLDGGIVTRKVKNVKFGICFYSFGQCKSCLNVFSLSN